MKKDELQTEIEGLYRGIRGDEMYEYKISMNN